MCIRWIAFYHLGATLFDFQIIYLVVLCAPGVDYQWENDAGLLHLACVLGNLEAIQLLTQSAISSKIKDRGGKSSRLTC